MKLNHILVAATVFATAIVYLPSALAINPGQYQQVATEFRGADQEKARRELASFIKRQVKKDKRLQAVVLPFDDTQSATSVSGAANAAQQAMSKTLRESGIEIVNRAIPKKLFSELEAIENSGESMGSNYKLADYAFQGEINNIAQYQAPIKDENQRVTGCAVTSNVEMAISVYKMNPLELSDTVLLSGNAISRYSGRSCQGLDATSGALDGVRNTVSSNANKLKQLFLAEGRIVEHRAKGKKHIFRTTYLESSGVKPKMKVSIYKVISIQDPVTLEQKTEKALIGSGKVVKVEGTKHIWVSVSKKIAPQILLGDRIETSAGGCGLLGCNNALSGLKGILGK